MNNKNILIIFIIVFIVFYINVNSSSDQFDEWTKKYDKILKSYIKPGELKGISLNLVDYKGLRENKEIEKLESDLSKLPSVKNQPVKKQLAFWINTYNFLTIVKIIRNPGLKSIRNLNKGLTTVWQQTAGIINNEKITLDQIEHEIIRKEFNEPRIHFAVNCASISCPDLRTEAYFPDNLDKQLEDQLLKTLDNQKKGMLIDHKKRIIYLSKIFSWYSADFSDNVKLWLKNKNIINDEVFEKYTVKYFNYDWDLNSIPGRN